MNGFVFRACSPYTALALRGKAPLPVVPHSTVLDDGSEAGPWLLAEAKQALEDLKAKHPKERDLLAHMRIGLVLQNQAHVTSADDPEATVLLNPKFLIDGLGRWPATIHRSVRHVAIRTDDSLYYIALIVRNTN